MKIREGFVSNSSSTSFCIYGIYLRGSREERFKMYEVAEEARLFVHGDQYGVGVYIGREWSSIGDEETGSMFKEDTKKRIDKLSVDNRKCSTHEGGWFDG